MINKDNCRIIIDIENKEFAKECRDFLSSKHIYTYAPCETRMSLTVYEANLLHEYARSVSKEGCLKDVYYVEQGQSYIKKDEENPLNIKQQGYVFNVLSLKDIENHNVSIDIINKGKVLNIPEINTDVPIIKAPFIDLQGFEDTAKLQSCVLLAIATDYCRGIGGKSAILPDGYDSNWKLRETISEIQFLKSDIYKELSIETDGKFNKAVSMQIGEKKTDVFVNSGDSHDYSEDTIYSLRANIDGHTGIYTLTDFASKKYEKRIEYQKELTGRYKENQKNVITKGG